MNLLAADARSYASRLEVQGGDGVEVLLCPPHILIPVLREALGKNTPVRLGAQDLHPETSGAHTGEHSGAMIADAGAEFVIVGHSERRAAGEDDETVRRKVAAAFRAGLRPIVCIGEQLEERERGATLRVLRNQLTIALSGMGHPAPDPADLVVAYEPVWAIGTGRHATASQAQEALSFVRDRLGELFGHGYARRVRLLYGGSVNEKNTASLAGMPDVDGFLIGGAGLDPVKLSGIIADTARVRALPGGTGA
jgi:triosephosphate isomerase